MKSVLKKAARDARDERALRPDLLEQYECGPVPFSGAPNASYERHLVFDHVVRPERCRPARAVRGRGRGRSATCSPSAG